MFCAVLMWICQVRHTFEPVSPRSPIFYSETEFSTKLADVSAAQRRWLLLSIWILCDIRQNLMITTAFFVSFLERGALWLPRAVFGCKKHGIHRVSEQHNKESPEILKQSHQFIRSNFFRWCLDRKVWSRYRLVLYFTLFLYKTTF